jgi:uncharacterized OsmC-like protein
MSLITIKHEQDCRLTASVRNHKLTIDLPPDQGGEDAGLMPVELLVAALGSCMAMHIATYCRAAKLPHEGLSVDLAFQLAKDPLRIGSVTADITLPPGFPKNRLEAVNRVAQQCIVKNTLKESTVVDLEILS